MKLLNICLFLLLSLTVHSQLILLEGRIVDTISSRTLDEVEVKLYSLDDDGLIATVYTDIKGQFFLPVRTPGLYVVRCMREAYYDKEQFVELSEEDEMIRITMNRLPGYEFEATVKELFSYTSGQLGKELRNIKIEVYNSTTGKELIVTEDDPDNTFRVNFERGNHYTILLRKKGYFAKRIEVYVDVDDCILCFEGLGTYASPEIESALTSLNERGSIISDIPMKKIIQDEAIVLDNIYYDYDKSNIRRDATPALERLVRILRRNPIIIELSSHTDSRGKSDYNMVLSQRRAQSAVDYIVSRGIKSSRITAKGYGESQLVNACADGTQCSEEEHQKNRRTEFKVTAFVEESNFDKLSLKQIIEQEKLMNSRLKESIIIMEN